jgi:hypothetical protein
MVIRASVSATGTSAKPLERRLAVHGYVVPALNEMVCRSLIYMELGQTGQDWYDLVCHRPELNVECYSAAVQCTLLRWLGGGRCGAANRVDGGVCCSLSIRLLHGGAMAVSETQRIESRPMDDD